MASSCTVFAFISVVGDSSRHQRTSLSSSCEPCQQHTHGGPSGATTAGGDIALRASFLSADNVVPTSSSSSSSSTPAPLRQQGTLVIPLDGKKGEALAPTPLQALQRRVRVESHSSSDVILQLDAVHAQPSSGRGLLPTSTGTLWRDQVVVDIGTLRRAASSWGSPTSPSAALLSPRGGGGGGSSSTSGRTASPSSSGAGWCHISSHHLDVQIVPTGATGGDETNRQREEGPSSGLTLHQAAHFQGHVMVHVYACRHMSAAASSFAQRHAMRGAQSGGDLMSVTQQQQYIAMHQQPSGAMTPPPVAAPSSFSVLSRSRSPSTATVSTVDDVLSPPASPLFQSVGSSDTDFWLHVASHHAAFLHERFYHPSLDLLEREFDMAVDDIISMEATLMSRLAEKDAALEELTTLRQKLQQRVDEGNGSEAPRDEASPRSVPQPQQPLPPTTSTFASHPQQQVLREKDTEIFLLRARISAMEAARRTELETLRSEIAHLKHGREMSIRKRVEESVAMRKKHLATGGAPPSQRASPSVAFGLPNTRRGGRPSVSPAPSRLRGAAPGAPAGANNNVVSSSVTRRAESGSRSRNDDLAAYANETDPTNAAAARAERLRRLEESYQRLQLRQGLVRTVAQVHGVGTAQAALAMASVDEHVSGMSAVPGTQRPPSAGDATSSTPSSRRQSPTRSHPSSTMFPVTAIRVLASGARAPSPLASAVDAVTRRTVSPLRVPSKLSNLRSTTSTSHETPTHQSVPTESRLVASGEVPSVLTSIRTSPMRSSLLPRGGSAAGGLLGGSPQKSQQQHQQRRMVGPADSNHATTASRQNSLLRTSPLRVVEALSHTTN